MIGLSPLAWGTLIVATQRANMDRFIPAGVGNSPAPPRSCASATVYPRWRGELSGRRRARRSSCGLSPLAWGTHKTPIVGANLVRFIPAGVGNSAPLIYRLIKLTVYPRWRGELSKHNLLLINDFLSQSQSTNFTGSHKQHIHYVKEHLIH